MTAEALFARTLDVPHGFFTRRGGVSEGAFSSLNCSLSGADPRDNVMENRARAARAVGADPAMLSGLTQVHGIDVAVIDAPYLPGTGPRADAMVSTRPGVALGIVTADCAPILFADSARGVIGAAHAGWRGAVSGIIEATLKAMQSLGATAITAAIGPCIRHASYEVADDFRDTVLAADARHTRFFTDGNRPGHWYFDLAGCCAWRLETAGVAGIETIDADTLSDPERFFSHRRRTLAGGGPLGHQISIVALPQ
jgi:YfiH family protein